MHFATYNLVIWMNYNLRICYNEKYVVKLNKLFIYSDSDIIRFLFLKMKVIVIT